MHDYIVRHDHYISIDVLLMLMLLYYYGILHITVCVYSMYVVCVFSVTSYGYCGEYVFFIIMAASLFPLKYGLPLGLRM